MSSSSIFSQPFYPPPPGVVPNPSNPQTRGRDLTVTCSVFLGIMIIFVSIRTYTKLWLMRKVTWDDRMYSHSLHSSQQHADSCHSDVYDRFCMDYLQSALSVLANSRLSKAPYRDLLCPLCKRYV